MLLLAMLLGVALSKYIPNLKFGSNFGHPNLGGLSVTQTRNYERTKIYFYKLYRTFLPVFAFTADLPSLTGLLFYPVNFLPVI
jgi:hypothetical protein